MTSDEIFESYLDEKCPVCGEHVGRDNSYAETVSGGKCMALYFICRHCESEYTIGFERRRYPIKSEIKEREK